MLSLLYATCLKLLVFFFINVPELNEFELISYVARPESRNLLGVNIFYSVFVFVCAFIFIA